MMNRLHDQQLEQHATVLGWLHIIGNLFFVLFGIFLFFFLSSVGVVTGDEQAVAILGLVGTFIGGLLAVIGLPGIVTGFGLLARKPWARYLAIVLGILNLLNAPIGTVIGIYTLWVLMQEDAADFFAAGSGMTSPPLTQREQPL